jgi:molecular chaperone GrpE
MTEAKENGANSGAEAEAPEAEPKKEHTKREAKIISITDVELEHLKKDLHENKDKYLRLLAETENTRKRLQKERAELIQYALQNIICDFLNPIDHMENALKFTQNMTGEVKNWATGFQMILGQFKDVLSNNGVQAFESVGTHFDPHRQEAIETVETNDYPSGTVVEESVKGYKMAEKVIRPARVKVSKTPAEPQEENLDSIQDINEEKS